MKAFLFSIFALALLIAVIFVNAAYVGRITGEIYESVQHLPECAQATAQAQALLTFWEKEERQLGLSVSATDINELGNHLTELCVAADQNDSEAFERARALCLLWLTRIRELERFSFLHIL